ncbi:10080_t:CDS:2, partial [Gigaspora rosea]
MSINLNKKKIKRRNTPEEGERDLTICAACRKSNDDEPLENIINHSSTKKTTFIVWFKANAIHLEAR